MSAKLYVVHGSHPCATVQRALDMKAVPYEVVELLPPLHAALQRLRFGTRTVPGLTLESGEKLVGSRAILRRLEELAPEPVALPGRPRRARRRRARRGVGRRGLAADGAAPGVDDARPGARAPWSATRTARGCRASRRPPSSRWLRSSSAVERRLNGADEGAVRADLRSLPGHLDRIDGWLADGVLGGETVNAADLQIATTSRLMLTIGDVRPFFAGRPAEAHAMGLFARVAGSTPAGVFPAEWLSARSGATP